MSDIAAGGTIAGTAPGAPGAARPTRRPLADRACVIVNPGSGWRRQGAQGRDLGEALAPFGDRFALRPVGRRERIDRVAREAVEHGYGTVVAAGGDGTISTVAAAISGSGARLGVIPFGTFNYFARGLGLPLELDRAAEVIVEGGARPLAIGEVNGRLFVNNASIGAYPTVLAERERLYRRYGRSRAVALWSVMRTLATMRRRMRLTITVDGVEHRLRTSLAFAARNPYQIELFGLEGAERVRAGETALFVAPDRGRGELMRSAVRLAARWTEPGRDFHLLIGRDIRIDDARKRRMLAWDGERARMDGPLRFGVREGTLEVMAPAVS